MCFMGRSVLVFVFVFSVFATTTCAGVNQPGNDDELPYLEVNGSHFSALYDASKHFKDKIQDFVEDYHVLYDVLIPKFYDVPEHRVEYDQYLDIVKSEYFNYYEEIRGISEGSQIEFYKIFLLNIRLEVYAILGIEFEDEKSDGCTDIHVNIEGVKVLGHNEDGTASIKDKAFVVKFEIDVGKFGEEVFVSYCYPGIIPGNAISWNQHGMVFTGNALTPKKFRNPGMPRMFIYRHSITGQSIDDSFFRIARIRNRAYGLSINVASYKDVDERINYEFSPDYFGFYRITGNYSHVNNYKILGEVSSKRGDSSIHRQNRIDEFEAPKSLQDVKAILSDVKDPVWPIFNNGTLATGIFDLIKKKVYFYTSNPLSSQPVLELDLDL